MNPERETERRWVPCQRQPSCWSSTAPPILNSLYTGGVAVGVAGGVVSKSSPDHLACGGIPELARFVSRGSQ